ncbi:unnamed protein product [Mytilus coruscus]|uniref:Reverse transcriptase/retrotransposon-derived protein RNase H-like domain-containing protein n=1 Tax=Mytilus coruscus TaxID=42192 RepID=A0A6J8EB86_MYTCO|nr:unnamed protein product [Mytilus coruscus]
MQVKEMTYIGHNLSADGVRPDQEKKRTITEMLASTDKKGVQRLLGTINYLTKFLPNMSAVTEHFRQKLLKEEHEFIWTHEQQKAFEKLRHPDKKSSIKFLRCVKTESWRFTHNASSPQYQQSNGLVEKFMQNVKKMLNKTQETEKIVHRHLKIQKYTSGKYGITCTTTDE